MADNTQIQSMTGGDVISTDDLTTQNDLPVSGIKVQRTKVTFGKDGEQTDVKKATPLPTVDESTHNVDINEIDGNFIPQSAPGIVFNSLADELGDPFSERNPIPIQFNGRTPIPISREDDIVVSGTLSKIGDIIRIDNFSGAACVKVTFRASVAPSMVVTPQVSINGQDWFSVPSFFTWTGPSFEYGTQVGNSSTFTLSASSHIMTVGVSGWSSFRLLVNTYTSGQTNVSMRASKAPISLAPLTTASADGLATTQVIPQSMALGLIYNGTSIDRSRSVINATNSTGTGIVAAGILAQLDDTAPTTITENQFGNLRMTPFRALHVSLAANTIPQHSLSRVKAAASTNATSLKASPGSVVGWVLCNNTAAAKFVKFYNKASAPTVGTDTPHFTLILPANGKSEVSWDMNVPFITGIAYAITGAIGDADTTATAVDDVTGYITWG